MVRLRGRHKMYVLHETHEINTIPQWARKQYIHNERIEGKHLQHDYPYLRAYIYVYVRPFHRVEYAVICIMNSNYQGHK
jgi:hypothetical protein